MFSQVFGFEVPLRDFSPSERGQLWVGGLMAPRQTLEAVEVSVPAPLTPHPCTWCILSALIRHRALEGVSPAQCQGGADEMECEGY